MVLTDIKQGEKAYIANMMEVDDIVRRRLIDFGIMKGCEITVKKVLLFGGPIAIEASGQCLGIRRRDAMRIQVEKCL